MLSPIVLFAYLRPLHTQKTLDALANNALAKQSILYVFVDGLKENIAENQENLHQEVKEIFEREKKLEIPRFKEIIINYRGKNIGLANNIITGVSEIIEKYGKIIVLEDDIVVSPFFLEYMNHALNMYEYDEKVMHISAYSPNTSKPLPLYFFTTSISSWGWATWARAWQKFNPDANYLIQQLNQNPQLKHKFNYENTYDHFSILEAYITRGLSTWAGRWYASVFLENGLSLWLGVSMVKNIGFDGTGEHCGKDDKYDTFLYPKSINLQKIPIEENATARQILKQTYKKMKLFSKKSFFQKFLEKIKKLAKNIICIFFLKK